MPDTPLLRGIPLPPRLDRKPAHRDRPSSSDIELAQEAAVAFERATAAQAETDALEGRVLALEAKVALLEQGAAQRSQSTAARQNHRTQVYVATIAGIFVLVAAVVTGAWQWASTTKSEAVQQSTYAVARKIEDSRKSTEATYDNGVQEGVEKFKRQLAEQGLVIVPREVIHARPSSTNQ